MKSIVISSGHGKYIGGANGYINEVTEARRVVECVAKHLKKLGVTTYTYNDDTSRTQNDNLNRIVKYHNSKSRELDVSIHFNAGTKSIGGVEVLYYDQKQLATKVSAALAKAMNIRDRGAKQNKELYFLSKTSKPAILIEVCFVDVKENTQSYFDNFDKVCRIIAETIAGKTLQNDKCKTCGK